VRRDHGGHIDYRSDVGNYSWVALYGIHDSDSHLDPDPQLEISGTYALCHAPYVPGDYSDCLTWTPHPDNYTCAQRATQTTSAHRNSHKPAPLVAQVPQPSSNSHSAQAALDAAAHLAAA
jgi:hypothetical protein